MLTKTVPISLFSILRVKGHSEMKCGALIRITLPSTKNTLISNTQYQYFYLPV